MNGIDGDDFLGGNSFVSNAGDINGDGFDDLIIGAAAFSRRGLDWLIWWSDLQLTKFRW
ncbi:integrin alpha [Nostoc sp.]|uniref:integrin alpha n=1 Tax=Nostoc sp. TaxID=1180 RepID=UPI003FA600A2